MWCRHIYDCYYGTDRIFSSTTKLYNEKLDVLKFYPNDIYSLDIRIFVFGALLRSFEVLLHLI